MVGWGEGRTKQEGGARRVCKTVGWGEGVQNGRVGGGCTKQ